MNFTTCVPEEVGIDSGYLINFLTRLENQLLPLHSVIIMRHNKICMEAYYEPYNQDSLHRMFSISKSFVSMAIGLLEEEGKLSLDDHIVDYFPEKQPEEGPYPYTAMLTIRQMLTMRTCHEKTTYKTKDITDWVESFFRTPPTNVPGTNFSYDTSSTHVLGALVEKLSGMNFLDYLRSKGLDELGFSKEAYCLTDPTGISMGGSGMCATPRDILIMMMLIVNDGKLNDKQYLPKEYVKTAKLRHADPIAKQTTLEEIQGYGYQLWQTTHGGYVMFGMGGQLALYVPEKDIYMITTADAQGRQGGVQLIYDAFWQEVYDKIPTGCDMDNVQSISKEILPKDLENFMNSRRLLALSGDTTSPIVKEINHKTYICDVNPCGVKNISLHFEDETRGQFVYENHTGTHSINFLIGDNAIGDFPDYHLKYAASAAWRMDHYFLIKLQIIDSAIGNLFMGFSFYEDYVTVLFRKIEESLFNEYDGVFSGKKI
ncbi:MAG: serine hydrolase [Cellulosilyticum sp.]|nr:serine hydrolase [Cellulosilyticum sp.]